MRVTHGNRSKWDSTEHGRRPHSHVRARYRIGLSQISSGGQWHLLLWIRPYHRPGFKQGWQCSLAERAIRFRPSACPTPHKHLDRRGHLTPPMSQRTLMHPLRRAAFDHAVSSSASEGLVLSRRIGSANSKNQRFKGSNQDSSQTSLRDHMIII